MNINLNIELSTKGNLVTVCEIDGNKDYEAKRIIPNLTDIVNTMQRYCDAHHKLKRIGVVVPKSIYDTPCDAVTMGKKCLFCLGHEKKHMTVLSDGTVHEWDLVARG